MAFIYELSLLCVIGIVIHGSAAYNQTFCLEGAVRFIRDRNRCRFNLSYADNILKHDGNCPRKCIVHMNNLDSGQEFSLREVEVTIGTEQKFSESFCQSQSITSVSMHVDCSSWIQDKYKVFYNYIALCQDRLDAQCYRIDRKCICHCNQGNYMYNGRCLQENIAVNQPCSYNMQCTRTIFANLCTSGVCACQRGYVLIGNHCFQGNIAVNQPCSYNMQCTRTRFATLCTSGLCSCQRGYVLIGNNCYQGNIAVNQPCSDNMQCTGTRFATLCTSGLCVCQRGYVLIGNNCYQDHVPVGGFCSLHEQCTGSNNSETCVNGRCRCSDGYLLIDLECFQGNLFLNQSCTHHEQCSSNNTLCIDEKCACIGGYTAENLTNCYKLQQNEFELSIGNQKDINIGPIMGTLFGGMIIGVILTSLIAILIFKQIRTDIKKKEEPIVMFANDVIYSSANVVECEDVKAFQENDKKRKVVNVLPNSCSEKGAVYSFVARKPRIVQPSEGVYNHLHEQERHDIVDDNYDHACVASNLEREPCIYSNMA